MMHGRTTWFEPQSLSGEQRALYERLVNGPRAAGPQVFRLVDDAGRLEGPFNALLLAPAVGTALQELGSAIRYRSSLPARAREIAILELAYRRRCEFEWYAHDRVGRAAGLSDAELTALAAGTAAPTFDETESGVRELVRTLLERRDLDGPSFERLQALLGAQALMEVVALVGYYDLLALCLQLFRTPLPHGAVPVFTSARAERLVYADAQRLVTAAFAYARAANLAPLVVTVLDARGALLCFGAQEGASLGREAIARGKASGALAMGFGSRSIAKRARDMPAFYAALAPLVPGGIVPVPGGVLIRSPDGTLLGAAGISGDSSDNDEAAALAGIAAIGLQADAGTD